MDALWLDSVPSAGLAFDPEQSVGLPDAARRYLRHAIAPGTPLASAVRLRMHGEILLKGWCRFTAEQVITSDRGMIWEATVTMYGIPIRGSDRLIEHAGAMRWKILGLIPLMEATGADTTRSTVGRMLAESVWLPSVFCRDDAVWREAGSSCVAVRVVAEGEHPELTLAVDDAGRVASVALKRWGNPDGAAYGYVPFGGIADREETFGGYTIPTRLRVGWYFGAPRFDAGGEFFRCTIDHAEFR